MTFYVTLNVSYCLILSQCNFQNIKQQHQRIKTRNKKKKPQHTLNRKIILTNNSHSSNGGVGVSTYH